MDDVYLVREGKVFIEYVVQSDYNRVYEYLSQFKNIPKPTNIQDVQRILYKFFRISFRRFLVQDKHELWVLDYNKYVKEWYPIQRFCRGTYVVVSKDGYISTYFSFTKFFNLNEIPGWYTTDLCTWDLTEVTRKADGTLIIHFWDTYLGEILGTRSLPHFVTVDKRTNELIISSDITKVRNPYVKILIEKFGIPKIDSSLSTYMYELVVPDSTGSTVSTYFEKEEKLYFLTGRDKRGYLLRYSKASDFIPEADLLPALKDEGSREGGEV